jgi:hypothetical protein
MLTFSALGAQRGARWVFVVVLFSLVACAQPMAYGGPPPPITNFVSPFESSLSFDSLGVPNAQTLQVTYGPASSKLYESNDCKTPAATIASVSAPASVGSQSADFTVTPISAGSCTLTFKNNRDAAARVSVTVSS